jgi:hypothetical protein
MHTHGLAIEQREQFVAVTARVETASPTPGEQQPNGCLRVSG